MAGGRLFQTRGPATANALSPSDVSPTSKGGEGGMGEGRAVPLSETFRRLCVGGAVYRILNRVANLPTSSVF